MRDWLKSLEKLEKRIVSGVETWYCAFYYGDIYFIFYWNGVFT